MRVTNELYFGSCQSSFIWPTTTNHFNNPRSGRRKLVERTSHIILWFSTCMERLSTATRLSSGLNRRRRRYNVSFLRFLTTSLKMTNFDIFSPFVVIPCTRRFVPQYFQCHSVVHFNMYSCAEQGAHSCVPSCSDLSKLTQRSIEIYLEKYIDWKMCDRRQWNNSSYLGKTCAHLLN